MPSPQDDMGTLRDLKTQQQMRQPIPMISEDDMAAVESAERYQATVESRKSKLDIADEIMRSDDIVEQEYLKRDFPNTFKEWSARKAERLQIVDDIFKGGDPEEIEAVKQQFPNTFQDYRDENQNALVKFGKGISKWAKSLINGKHEDYEEVGLPITVDTAYADSNQAAALIRQATTPDLSDAEMLGTMIKPREGLMGIWDKSLGKQILAAAKMDLNYDKRSMPKAMQTAYGVGNDVFGNPLVAFQEDLPSKSGDDTVMIPAGTPVYPNKPGVSAADYLEFLRTAPEVVVAAASGGQSYLGQLLTNMTMAVGVSASRQVGTELEAPSGDAAADVAFRIGKRAGAEGLISATFDIGTLGLQKLGQGGVRALRSVFGKAGAPGEAMERFVNSQAVEQAIADGMDPTEAIKNAITPEGMQFLGSKGVTADKLLPQVLDEMLAISRDPTAYGLDAAYNQALLKTFRQSTLISDLIDKSDPELRPMLEAEDALLSSKSQAGQTARDRLSGDLNRLNEAVEAYSGVSTTFSDKGMEDILPGMKAVERDARDRAGAIYARTLDEYVPQGYGQDILDSSGVLNKFAEIRRKFSEGFDKDLDKIDEVLFKYGAVDTPNKMRKKISDQLEAMHTRDAVSRERIRLSTTDPVVEKSKMDKFDKLAPSRHQAAVDVMNIRAKDKEFSDFTVESAVRMYKELNSLNFTDLPREVVSSLRTPINDAMNSLDTAVTDPVIRGFRKGNKAWSDFMKRYPEKSLSKTLIEALNSGNSDIPNIAASGVLSKLKGADPRNIEGMMRNLRRAKRGSPNAQNQAYLVQRSLQQSVVADLMNDVIVNAKELDAMTKEAWDTALTKWGSNPADGMRKIQAVLNKQQGQTVTSLYQLASSSTRRPVNSLTADTEEALFRTLYKQLSNSVWLTLKTPGLAAVVTAGRVVGERAKQKAGKQLAADIMDPYPSMERRLELYMKDPLRFKAEQGASKLPLDERKRRVKSSLGMEAVPYKRMTPEQKQAFHETYRNTYPDLYEFNLRETNRALGRKVISVGGREATTN